MKSREHVVTNGKAAFYACIWDDLRNAAMDCGWALGLHGSLASDMDIMAMPWTEDAVPVSEMIQSLSNCFTESPFKEHHTVAHTDKPNGRVVYTMTIWADFHLDINIIKPTIGNAKDYLESIGYQFLDEFYMEEYLSETKVKDLIKLMEGFANSTKPTQQ